MFWFILEISLFEDLFEDCCLLEDFCLFIKYSAANTTTAITTTMQTAATGTNIAGVPSAVKCILSAPIQRLILSLVDSVDIKRCMICLAQFVPGLCIIIIIIAHSCASPSL